METKAISRIFEFTSSDNFDELFELNISNIIESLTNKNLYNIVYSLWAFVGKVRCHIEVHTPENNIDFRKMNFQEINLVSY